jgi:hypothetical protein
MTFYGEHKCDGLLKNGNECKNLAYFKSDDKLLCGVHSRLDKNRIQLGKNPNSKQLKIDEKKSLLKLAKKWDGGKCITLTKLKMMKQVDREPGSYGIYPNFKHGGKSIDEIGLPSLSPKYGWQPKHKMKMFVDGELVKVPQAFNIENFHQGSKVFMEKGCYKRRDEMFRDETPWRHQFDKYPELKAGPNKNIPLYSIFSDSKGNEKKFSYLECRYFYCAQYEDMCNQNPDFQKLKEMYDGGAWLQIIGYDAYQPAGLDKESLWDAYNDISKPFGHELVLTTLITIKHPKNYPWNRFWNKEIYFGDWETPKYLK